MWSLVHPFCLDYLLASDPGMDIMKSIMFLFRDSTDWIYREWVGGGREWGGEGGFKQPIRLKQQ